jgi:hypothetical protein
MCSLTPDTTGRRVVSAATGPQLLVCEALSYYCVRPSATSVWGLQLLVYGAFSYQWPTGGEFRQHECCQPLQPSNCATAVECASHRPATTQCLHSPKGHTVEEAAEEEAQQAVAAAYLCVCVCVCVCACVCVCTYIHTHTHTYIHTYVHTYIHTLIAHTPRCMYVYMYTYIH